MTRRPASVPLPPPAEDIVQRGQWTPVPADDSLVAYVQHELWPGPHKPIGWQVARLSAAAYLYREIGTGWTVVAKFYVAKTGDEAVQYAQREMEMTQMARAAGLMDGGLRAQQALRVWRGVLLLEYVDGLTLEDLIAIRRHRPGELHPALEQVARLLATLHSTSARSSEAPDFADSVRRAHRLVTELSRGGVLQHQAVIGEGLHYTIDRWAARAEMVAYTPALIHGDATTTNFVFPWQDGCVAIDWERLRVADPAADVGRLMAEVAHSVRQYGGDSDEAEDLIEHFFAAYCRAACLTDESEALRQRATFFRASSTLRIARNGWLSRLERTALVAEALALLARCH